MVSSSFMAGGCVDVVHAPTKLRSTKLYRWAESDAEFLRLICVREGCASPGIHGSPLQSPQIGRQKYLRSYTFSRKEDTVSERSTRRWLQEKKELKKKNKKGGSFCSQGFGGAVAREVKERLVGASCFVFGGVVQCLFHCSSEHRC